MIYLNNNKKGDNEKGSVLNVNVNNVVTDLSGNVDPLLMKYYN